MGDASGKGSAAMSRRGSERERIEMLRGVFDRAGPHHANDPLIVGIGDDAAVLTAGDGPLVWTVDAAVEGTHFRRQWLSFEDIGYRSTMAALSDLAAMGAAPLGVLSALILPEDVDDEAMMAIARGQRDAARDVQTAVIGGNLARGNELSITTTALGHVHAPLLRSGANPGETVWLLGRVGRAAAGLRFLMRASGSLPNTTSEDRIVAAKTACIQSWRRPTALVAEGLSLRGFASAAIDISDGLVRDVDHLARASGVIALIDVAALYDAELERAAAELQVTALELALFGGEDYALVVAAPADIVIKNGVKIGWFEKGDVPFATQPLAGDSPRHTDTRAYRDGAPVELASVEVATRVWGVWPDGTKKPLLPRGFDHFDKAD